MIPNRYDVVVQLDAEGYFDRAATGDQRAASLFARLVAYRLNPTGAADSWGWLTKQPGETQVDGYAEDAIVYGSTPSDLVNVVDLVVGAGAPGARIAWQAGKPRRPSNTWERPRPLTEAEMDYLKAGSGGGGTGGGGGGGGGTQPTCQYQPTDLGPVLARLAALEQAVQSLTDTAVGAEVAALEAAAGVRELVRVLQSPGMQVDCSARIIGPVRGTARLPTGGAV